MDDHYRCHLGKTIIYDTVSNSSWTVDVRLHGIVNVIERLLADPWPPSVEVGREVPEAKAEVDCVVRIISVPSPFFSLKSDFCFPSGVLQLGIWGFSCALRGYIPRSYGRRLMGSFILCIFYGFIHGVA